jgi:hypothetical protein
MMNFDPKTTAWLQLICLIFGTASGVGYTAYLSGASVVGACICGFGSGFMQVYHSISDSPQTKVDKAMTAAPFDKRP